MTVYEDRVLKLTVRLILNVIVITLDTLRLAITIKIVQSDAQDFTKQFVDY